MNISQDQQFIERTRKNVKNSTKSIFKSPSGTSVKDSTFFDFETVGDLGDKDFGIIEMATKTAKGVQSAFFQLGEDAARSIKSNIETVRKHGSKAISENALRSIKRMLDYKINDDNTISALHKDLEGINLTSDSPLLDYASQMVDIFSTLQGIDGKTVGNIKAFEAGKRGL
jgi:hypothetical protein